MFIFLPLFYKLHFVLLIFALIFKNAFYIYSLLNANTGSSFAAFLEGIIPPISVKTILNIIKITPAVTGSEAVTSTPFEIELIIWFVGINNNNVIPTPIKPARVPTINVSALNLCRNGLNHL